MRASGIGGTICAILVVSPASAGDLFVGVYKHGVAALPTSKTFARGGADLEFGYRFGRLEALRIVGAPSPYTFGSLNSRDDTSLAAAGLS